MPWVLLPLVIPLLIFAVLVRRVVRVGQQLRDPEQLRLLFSDEVRAALRQAGFDPDTIRMEEIQESEQLTRLVADDLRRALRGAVLGRGPAETHTTPRTPGPEVRPAPGLAHRGWGGRGSDRTGQLGLPPPIDPRSGPPPIALLALAVAALVAVALLVTRFQ
jgi:hypothetical protein